MAEMQEATGGRVSVIIPARNEERNLARVIGSLAGQERLLEIIVVDDASTDATASLLRTLQQTTPCLRVVRVESLPAGWTGKTHACALGAEAAQGDWLLFTDADTEHRPGSLGYWVKRAEGEGWDVVSLSPGQVVHRWWEKAVIPRVFVQLARWYPFEEISNPATARAAANGQYLLARREVYLRAGGFESVRGEILEDVRLAERLQAAGARMLFLPGGDWVETRMYATWGAMWEGWTKNLYWLAEGRWKRALATVTEAWLLEVLPPAGVVVFGAMSVAARRTGLAMILAVGCLFLWLARRARYARELAQLGFERRLANYQSLGGLLMSLLMLYSFCAYRLGWRIEWKGRAYAQAGAGKRP